MDTLPDPDRELAGVRHEQAFHARTFAGRGALLARVDAILEERAAGGVLLLGGPGTGKSALAAEIARRHADRGALLHMIKSHRSPRRFLPSLIGQAARVAGARFGAEAYTGDVEDLRDALVRALEAVVAKVGRAVLVIDALDELDAGDQRLAFLPAALPEGARLVLTCRPDVPLVAAVRARVAGLAEETVPPLSEGDLARLAELRLVGIDGRERLDLGALRDRTGGNPLLVGRALGVLARDLAAGAAPRVDRLPATLADVFGGVYREIAADAQQARLVEIMAVAREALAIAELAEIAALPLAVCRARVESMSQFLLDLGDGRFAPWHRGLADHVREQVLGESGVRAIEAAIVAWTATPSAASSAYALRHRAAHLLALGRAGEAAEILRDGRQLEARIAAGLVFDLVAELGDVARALPEGDEERGLLELVARAIRLHACFLDRHPSALFQTLHNAITWYDVAASCDASGEQAMARALAWLAAWREAKRAAEPGFPWLRALRAPPASLGTALLSVLRGHAREVLGVAVSQRGDRIASASEDGTVRIWDARTGGVARVLRASTKRALAVAFSPDGRHVAAGTDEGRVRVWDAHDGAETADWPGHDGPVWAVAFSPDGATIASGGRDRSVRARSRAGEEIWRRDVDGVVTSIAFSPDGARLAATLTSGAVLLCSAATGEEIARWDALDDAAWCVDFAPDGARLAVAAADGSVRVLAADRLAVVAELSLPDERLWTCAFSPDGRRVACGGTGRRIYLWTPDGELAPLPSHDGWINAVAFAPDGASVVSAGADRTVRVFATSAGLARPRDRSDVKIAAFSPRGRHLAVGLHDGRVEIWNASTGRNERTLDTHARSLTAVAFSPDERLVAHGTREGTAAVHRIDGRAIARLDGHDGAITSIAFTRDGGRVLTGSSDQTARLWTLLGARETHRFEHGEAIAAVAVSDDGARIAAGARGGEVRVWEIASGAELARVAIADIPSGRSGEADPRLRDIARVHFSADGETVAAWTRAGATARWSVDTGAAIDPFAGALPTPANEAPRFELRAAPGADETELRRAEDGDAVAWYPLPLQKLRAAPSGVAWVSWDGADIHLIALELG